MRRSHFVGYIFIFLLCMFPVYMYAVEQTFTVSVSLTDTDVDVPTSPTSLSGNAVSLTQIDLSWSAATDNIAVAGYRVYRDNQFVATTTNLIYQDIALNAATTYSYRVDAFDAALNSSGLTSAVSVTTLSPEIESGNGNSGSSRSQREIQNTEVESVTSHIQNLIVSTKERSAEISWNSSNYARAKVYWGNTQDYEDGTISGVVYQKDHVVKIENLTPGSEYFYRIELFFNNNEYVVYNGSFFSKAIPLDESVIENIHFDVVSSETSIILAWDFFEFKSEEKVRVVRSEKFFPVDPYDGKIVYEGVDEHQFIDTKVETGKKYYYALFVLNDDGTVSSSGSLGVAGVGAHLSKNVFASSPYSPLYEKVFEELTFADFNFEQNGEKISFLGGGLKLAGDMSTKISVDAEYIPLGIKALLVTFIPQEINGNSSTFVLAPNAGHTLYEAVISTFDTGGLYDVEIDIFDTSNNKVKTLYAVAQVDIQIPMPEEGGYIERTVEYVTQFVSKTFSAIVKFFGGLIAWLL